MAWLRASSGAGATDADITTGARCLRSSTPGMVTRGDDKDLADLGSPT
jgi:hypothetical protein